MAQFVQKFDIGGTDVVIQDPAYLADRNSILDFTILTDVKALLIGDSYNAGAGGVSGQGWGYYFQQYSGCDATIIAQNGGGFSALGNNNADFPNMTFTDVINQLANTWDSSVRSAYKLIVVAGGWNDGSSNRNPDGYSGTVSKINSFVTACKTNFPNAKIFIVPVKNETAFSSVSPQLNNFIAWYQQATLNGVASTDEGLFWNYGWSQYGAGDDIHLSDEGYQLMAHKLLSFVNGGNLSSINVPRSCEVEDDTDIVYEYTPRYTINKFHVTISAGIQVTANLSASKVLMTLPPEIRPARNTYISVFLYKSGGTRYILPAVIFASNGNVQLRNSSISLPSDGYIYLTGCTFNRMI